MTTTQSYIGTKIVLLTPMSRLQYNEYRGWPLPSDEDGNDEGYLVEYTDGGKPNDPRHAGYISWSPKAQADAAYRPASGMPFGLAIEAMKQGKRVARAGWNGKGMWLRILNPYAPHPDTVGGKWVDAGSTNPYFKAADNNEYAIGTMLPWIGMKTADNGFVPWLASQTDMLADDWMILD